MGDRHRLPLALCTQGHFIQDLVPLFGLQHRDKGGEVGSRGDMNYVALPSLNMVPPVCFGILVERPLRLYLFSGYPPGDSTFGLFIKYIMRIGRKYLQTYSLDRVNQRANGLLVGVHLVFNWRNPRDMCSKNSGNKG
jgi:hypothetical protein